jgi:positive regulator of sigma E activity
VLALNPATIGTCISLFCHPWKAALVLLVGVIYLRLASLTAMIAKRIGRGEQTWRLYALAVPVFSYLHVKILERRHSTRGTD